MSLNELLSEAVDRQIGVKRQNEEKSAVGLKKIKQESVDDGESSNDIIQQLENCDNFEDDSNSPSTSNHPIENLTENEEDQEENEQWQKDVNVLIDNEEATFDDYSTLTKNNLKWVVKHGIRLALTCTNCHLMSHDDICQFIQDHGLICDKQYFGPKEFNPLEFTLYQINTNKIPYPIYNDIAKINLRKSLDNVKNTTDLVDVSSEIKDYPLKYIVKMGSKKRGGICTLCGEIFLSIDHKKWAHSCWRQDNEVNGYLINENDFNKFLDYSMDEAANKNPDLLRYFINKSLIDEERSKGSDPSNSEPRLKKDLNVFDREWAYSIQDRYFNKELKIKPLFDNSDYSIQYLTNKKNTILATTCLKCKRIFPPAIDALYRSRHNKFCYLYTSNRIPQNDYNMMDVTRSSLNDSDANLSGENKIELLNKLIQESTSKRVRDLNLKRLRSRKNYMLKRMDKNLNYNINLENLMVKSLVSDLLPVDTFYLGGIKSVFNKLLRIGYELGQQPGTVLPTFDELLPQHENIENSLETFVNFDKFKDIFDYVSNAFQPIGGTIAVESTGHPNQQEKCNTNLNEKGKKDNSFVTISLIILDEYVPKRLVVDFIQNSTPTLLREKINSILKRMDINSEMCNLLVDKRGQKSIKNSTCNFETECSSEKSSLETFALNSSCFGSFLNDVTMKVFDETILMHLSDESRQEILDLKRTLDLLPRLFDFLLKKCDFQSDIRSILKCEFDTRWFVQTSLCGKLMILLKSYYDVIVERIRELDDIDKEKFLSLIYTANQQLPLLQQYKAFVQIFILHFEACTINRRATLHLVIPKFKAIHQQLKKIAESQSKHLQFQQFCSLAIDIMDSMEDEILNKSHFFATLLAPGHRHLLKEYYTEEQIMDHENDLIQAIKNNLPKEDTQILDESNDVEVEIEKFFEADFASRIDPLNWWFKNESIAPRISLFAQRLFTIPAASCQLIIPSHLSNIQFDDFMKSRLLYNWTMGSEVQLKRRK